MKAKEKPSPGPGKKRPKKSFYSYSSIAVKMIVVIVAGTFGGRKLDDITGLEFPVFTLVLSLLSVSLAMYIVIRDLIR